MCLHLFINASFRVTAPHLLPSHHHHQAFDFVGDESPALKQLSTVATRLKYELIKAQRNVNAALEAAISARSDDMLEAALSVADAVMADATQVWNRGASAIETGPSDSISHEKCVHHSFVL